MPGGTMRTVHAVALYSLIVLAGCVAASAAPSPSVDPYALLREDSTMSILQYTHTYAKKNGPGGNPTTDLSIGDAAFGPAIAAIADNGGGASSGSWFYSIDGSGDYAVSVDYDTATDSDGSATAAAVTAAYTAWDPSVYDAGGARDRDIAAAIELERQLRLDHTVSVSYSGGTWWVDDESLSRFLPLAQIPAIGGTFPIDVANRDGYHVSLANTGDVSAFLAALCDAVGQSNTRLYAGIAILNGYTYPITDAQRQTAFDAIYP